MLQSNSFSFGDKGDSEKLEAICSWGLLVVLVVVEIGLMVRGEAEDFEGVIRSSSEYLLGNFVARPERRRPAAFGSDSAAFGSDYSLVADEDEGDIEGGIASAGNTRYKKKYKDKYNKAYA